MTNTETEETRPESFLVADCGSTNTRVLLFDVVDGVYRLIGRATTMTTTTAPWSDITQGITNAIQQLSEMTGRQLLSSTGKVLTPEKANKTGVDHFMLVVSAAPALKTILVGLSEDVSLNSARRVLHTVYAQEVDTFSLSDGRSEDEQVAAIMKHKPDLIFLTGGTDGGADQRLLTFARTVSLGVTMLTGAKRVPVLYAGNKEQREEITKIMGEGIVLHVENNVRPSLNTENLADAANMIGNLYQDLRIKELPGLHNVLSWGKYPPLPTARAFATITQYFAALQKGQVLGVELGTESVTLVAASQDHADLTIRSDLGMGRSIINILKYVKPAEIAHWMPTEISNEEIRDFLYNKSLYPQTIAMSPEELQLEHAIAREMLRIASLDTAVDWQSGRRAPLPFRLLLVRGNTFANTPRPGQIISVLLDALQPVGIFAVAMDRYGILPALGALAQESSLAVVQTLESKIMADLGWVVVPVGKAQPGHKALHVRIESEQQTHYEGDVEFGTLEVFVLERGRSTVTLTPSRRFDVGFGPGKSTTITLSGGEVGLVVDARGRPLQLPQDTVARRSLVRQWLYDMGG
ncbi:MAG: glutamate mutase L [Anaerolineales bacterium]|nr:glutamate mutase L [Anaerolineales bacterium]MCB8966299.1 glutamate mutase L [Ardenticatenaceae bacterium]